ncbi:sensor histidine kinase [Streptococcus didelphis]|uniref:sensor histidine kinase n=1 Tax=Streptococcus didelphis TaxID=102886 RepID=UPI000369155A|nr:sensor histidine kinase [Streptococcus didelphis]WMB28954.1 sensor histidine kinase [Streptococcus didelphis]
MILKFLKEYKVWYLQFFLLFALFIIMFSLYRLPLTYFFNTGLICLTLLILFSLWQYKRFKEKITILQEFIYVNELSSLHSPSEEAYRDTIIKLINSYSESHLKESKRQQDFDALIKLWVHQMKLPLSALSLMGQTKEIDFNEYKIQIFRMENYLSQLLNYLKFSQDKDDFRFEIIELNDLIKQIIRQMSFICISKDIRINLLGQWQLTSDKKWLTFALSQIIENAIKYSRRGGQINIILKNKSITISDNGIGILEEDLPRLFDEGFTGYNGHEHQKASGLGLYMTKNVLEKLNLSIKITSQIDLGTSVSITPIDR